jgi:hypothetical protein
MTVGRPFKKGETGNAGGRPRGIDRRLRERFGGDVEAMTEVQVSIAKGKKPEGVDFGTITAADSTRAYVAVMDRLGGKPSQHVEHGGELNIGPPVPMSKLTREQLEALAALDGGAPDGVTEH